MTCELWAGAEKGGYGQRYLPDFKTRLVHRQVYCAANGLTEVDILGLCVRHTCDTPLCVLPAHLLLGTHADNMQDKAARRRTCGDRATYRKLSSTDVADIRRLWPGVTKTELSRRYSVGWTAIHNVILGLTWNKTEGE